MSMMASSSSHSSLVIKCSFNRHSPVSPHLAISSSLKDHPWQQKELHNYKASSSLKLEIPRSINSVRLEIPRAIKDTFIKLLDAFVDSFFEFTDQTLLPSQKNFGPVDELREAIHIDSIEGKIPSGFAQGVYVRNGPNPLFGGLKTARSVFGKSSHSWIEGEGMLHAVYFDHKDGGDGKWNIRYNNKHVHTQTFKMEKQRNRPSFLPSIEGDSAAVSSAMLLNSLRFDGKVDKYTSNTNVFEHSGKYYSIAENYIPQEIDIATLKTLSDWDIDGAWDRAFTSHPKKAPGSGELVIVGVSPIEPYMELGVISADGKKLVHRVDLKLNRCSICHEMGVTQRYNVIMDWPLTLNLNRLIRGGPFLKFERGEYMRLGVMPRYGSSDDIRWFTVDSCSMLHIFNCFEDDNDRVVVRGCRSVECIIPGPDFGRNKFEWFSKRLKKPDTASEQEISLLACGYEWILDMKTGEVKERSLTAITNSPMEIPFINPNFTGITNQFGYAHVAHSAASSTSGMVKYGALAKLHFNDSRIKSSQENSQCEDAIKVEYHTFGDNIFCNGAAFVAKEGGIEEDDGWLITFVHNECTDVSQVYIIDAKNISTEPIAKIILPARVPYGFHGTYIHLGADTVTEPEFGIRR